MLCLTAQKRQVKREHTQAMIFKNLHNSDSNVQQVLPSATSRMAYLSMVGPQLCIF